MPAPRRTPQQTRSQRRREAILQATAHLLSTQDYAAISVGDIAKHAHTSVGSLYQYFATKDAVLQALIELYIADMQALSAELFMEHAPLPPFEVTFSRAIDALVAYAVAHPGFKTILNSDWVSPQIKNAVQGLYAGMFDGIVGGVGRYAPHISAAEREAAARVIMSLVEGLLLNLTTSHDAQRTLLIHHFKQAGLAYLKTILAN